MRIQSLIHSEHEPAGLLPGSSTFPPDVIRDAHKRVTPVYDAGGNVQFVEIDPKATTTDICAVLTSCGIPVAALTGLDEIDPFSRPQRYQLAPAAEIGPDATI
jgi:hypothetical protein